jgi:hypothetical protein
MGSPRCGVYEVEVARRAALAAPCPARNGPLLLRVLAELELKLIQIQMAQKPMLRAEVYARALRASSGTS